MLQHMSDTSDLHNSMVHALTFSSRHGADSRLLSGLSNRQGRLIDFSRAVEGQHVLSRSGAGNSGRFIIEGVAISFWAKALNCFQILCPDIC